MRTSERQISKELEGALLPNDESLPDLESLPVSKIAEEDLYSYARSLGFQYPADVHRYLHVLSGLKSRINRSRPLWKRLLEYDELTAVRNHGNKLVYYEGWVDSCWEGLRSHPEYKQLGRNQCIEKLMTERFPLIAATLDLQIDEYCYRSRILTVVLNRAD